MTPFEILVLVGLLVLVVAGCFLIGMVENIVNLLKTTNKMLTEIENHANNIYCDVDGIARRN